MKTQAAFQKFADSITSQYEVPSVRVSLRKKIIDAGVKQTVKGVVVGRTYYKEAVIAIATEVARDQEDTIRHELAHWVARHKEPLAKGHNRQWRRWARRLGAHPRARERVA